MAMDLWTSTTRLRWILCLLLVAAIGGDISVHATEFGAVAGNSAAIESLGRMVYLPDVSLQTDHNSERSLFDADTVNNLAKTSKETYHNVDFKWFNSSDKFKDSIAVNMGVKGSVKGVSMSVESEFKRVTGSETDVKVAEVEAVRFHSKTYIPDDALRNISVSDAFVEDFNKLPDIVVEAHEEGAWSPFRDFMRNWGSHIVVKAYTGAVYQRWSSARSDLHYSENRMKAKTCVGAEGLKPVGALEVCAGYSESSRQDSENLETFDSKRVKGGTAKTRSKLATGLATPKLLEKFLNEEADVDQQPVRYEYLPVWDFIRGSAGIDEEDNRRALGLQAYYEGWKAAGCPLVTETGQDNYFVQGMVPEVKAEEYTGYYLCIRRCLGCHHYSADCHYEVTRRGGCCKLYGPAAISVDSDDRAYISANADQGWCGYSNGCEFVIDLFKEGCFCKNQNAEHLCNYILPMNDPKWTWLRYKILWNQHSLTVNEENPAIASVVDALEP